MKYAINKAIHNLHVPLAPSLYRELKEEAHRANQPATTLARLAIKAWLKQRQKMERHRAIASYAAEMAGTEIDLDENLEAATLKHLSETV